MLHALSLLLHRVLGLTLSVFLVVAGVTGSIITFQEELDALIIPELLVARPTSPGAKPLPAATLFAALNSKLPAEARITAIYLERRGDASATFTVAPPNGAAHKDDQYFVDPYTGEVLGSRHWGDLSQGRKNFVPFIYNLHYSLALGSVGSALLGFVALMWTFDCFVGAYLTFPPQSHHTTKSATRRRGPRSWLLAWARAWLLKASKLFALVFTWHRASGLWLWALLLMFAWSGVALNLYGEVYEPVMSALLPDAPNGFDAVKMRARERAEPRLDWPAALIRGEELLAEQATYENFEILTPERLRYFPKLGHFQYRARTSRDVSNRYALTAVWFDSDTGEFVALDLPTGENAMTTFTSWLYALHFGSWAGGGLPYRVLVCLSGLLVVLLSASGVLVWWGKREKRLLRRNRRQKRRGSSGSRADHPMRSAPGELDRAADGPFGRKTRAQS